MENSKDNAEAGFRAALAAVGGNEFMLAEVVTALYNAGVLDSDAVDMFDEWIDVEVNQQTADVMANEAIEADS